MQLSELLKHKRRILKDLDKENYIAIHDVPIFMEYLKLLEECINPEFLQESFNLVEYYMVIHSGDYQMGDEDHLIPCKRIFHKGFTVEQIKEGLLEQAKTLLSFMGSQYTVWIKIKKITETTERPGKITIQMKQGIWDWGTYPKG